jgi:hypothetical protein
VNYLPLPPAIQAVPVDEGFIDYSGFLSALCDGGFRGTIAYEICSPVVGGGGIDNLDRYSRRFLDFVNRVSSAASQEGVLAEQGR